MGAQSYNAAIDMVDRNVAEGRAGKVAFIDPTRKLSYGELAEGAARIGPMLARLGLQREDRVAMMMLDTVDFPMLFWGAIRAGIVPVPLNTLLTAEQYRYILEDSRTKALFVSAPLRPVAREASAGLNLKTIVVGNADDLPRYDALLAAETKGAEPASTSADEVAFWLYSSGSTGMPKGVRHVHSSAMATAKLYAQDALGIREDDVVYSAAKLFFAYGLGNGMSFPMSVGATAVLLPDRPTPQAVFAVLKREQPTIFCGVPTLYAAMLADPACTPENSSARLRDIYDGVGSTEMLHIFLGNFPGTIKYGTSGKAIPGYEARLIDDTGREVPEGEIGELSVRGPSAADGYWNQREKTRRTFEGEWTRTGDKYTLGSDGFYRICGRTDDMFKVSGQWVSPFEVEAALITHPRVLECAIVPKEDADGLLKPKAFIVLKGDGGKPGADELQEHVKRQVGPWKYPRWIEFVEGLPKTATGKIQRFKLRD
jgi:4-hydroxybenzoate-CoA ligase